MTEVRHVRVCVCVSLCFLLVLLYLSFTVIFFCLPTLDPRDWPTTEEVIAFLLLCFCFLSRTSATWRQPLFRPSAASQDAKFLSGGCTQTLLRFFYFPASGACALYICLYISL